MLYNPIFNEIDSRVRSIVNKNFDINKYKRKPNSNKTGYLKVVLYDNFPLTREKFYIKMGDRQSLELKVAMMNKKLRKVIDNVLKEMNLLNLKQKYLEKSRVFVELEIKELNKNKNTGPFGSRFEDHCIL